MLCWVNSCCCGCSLRTGSVVIGILDLLTSTILCIGSISLSTVYADYSYDYGKISDTFIYLAVVSGIMLIMDISLLIGVCMEKPSFIVPWLRYSYVNLVTITAGYLILGIMYLGLDYGASNGISFIAAAVVSLGLKVYFIMVVRSHCAALISVTYDSDDEQVTAYAVDLPQPYPNGQPQFYPNMNVQQMGYPNEQQAYTSGQQYPNDQQTYTNSQSPYPSDFQYQYPVEHQQSFQSEQQRFPRVQPQRFQSEQQRFQNEQQRYRSGPQHYVTYPNSGNQFHPDADQEFPTFNAPNVRRFAQ